MTKEGIKRIFSLRFNRLSNRAAAVLERLKLNDFTSFFNFFIEQRKMIDFSQLRNCGHATQKELTHLINSILNSVNEQNSTKPQQLNYPNKIEKFFDNEFKQLSTRTKNILSNISANYFSGFTEKVLQNNSVFNLNQLRNCGAKSYSEILEFQKSIANVIKEESLLSNSTEELNNEAEHLIQKKINPRIELEFDRLFDAMSNRTKNVLINASANNLRIFIENILNADVFDLSKFKNCGEKTRNEIIELQTKVSELLNNDTCEEKSTGFFKDLEIYLFEGNVLKPVDIEIFTHYFAFIQKKENKTSEEIAVNFNLTKERVRQLSFVVLEKVQSIVEKLFAKSDCNIINYYEEECFVVSNLHATKINKLENTDFSPAFINHTLEWIKPKSFDFIAINTKAKEYSGLFIKNSIPFNFKGCFEYVLQYFDIRRKEDVKIELDNLFRLFKRSNNYNLFAKPDELNLIEQVEVLKVFKLFQENYSDIENEIQLTQDFIIIKRNTKKLKHEFIIDILNEYKKPLHFTELYEECLKRNIKVTSALSIHGMMQHYPEVFGLKGPGIYGLKQWGGRFGTIGDVAEQIIKEKNQPIDRRELINTLCRELYVSQDSVSTVLFFYEPEKRFIKLKNDKVGLREWLTKQ